MNYGLGITIFKGEPRWCDFNSGLALAFAEDDEIIIENFTWNEYRFFVIDHQSEPFYLDSANVIVMGIVRLKVSRWKNANLYVKWIPSVAFEKFNWVIRIIIAEEQDFDCVFPTKINVFLNAGELQCFYRRRFIDVTDEIHKLINNSKSKHWR